MISPHMQIGDILSNINPLRQGTKNTPGSDGSFSDILGRQLKSDEYENMDASKDPLAEDCIETTGREFIEKFKKYLLAEGGALGNMTVDAEALDCLQEMLLGAGFDPTDVQNLIDKLSASARMRELKLPEIFEGIRELEDAQDEGPVFELSASPYIESILSSLGMDVGRIDQILEGAKIEGQGIDQLRLLAGLKRELQHVSGDGNLAVDEKSQSRILAMMGRIGMRDGNSENDPVTLEKFVSELEAMIDGQSDEPFSNRNLATDLKRFMENVHSTQDVRDREKGLRDAYPIKSVDLPDSGIKNFEPSANHALGNGMDQNAFLEDPVVKPGETIQGSKRLRDVSRNSSAFRGDSNVSASIAESGGAETGAGSRPAARALPVYVMNQVGRQLSIARQRGENDIRFQLKPPEMGRLHMSIENSKDGLKVSIIAEQQATRDMLLSHSGDLKSALMDQGVRLEKLDVQIAYNFEQSMTDAREGYKRRQAGRREAFRLQDIGENESVGREVTGASARNEGALDLVA